jgi:hypothetical protein
MGDGDRQLELAVAHLDGDRVAEHVGGAAARGTRKFDGMAGEFGTVTAIPNHPRRSALAVDLEIMSDF